jgi:5-methyltetrahydropteroyltriglutamate--homocysteine methyltransferase
MKCSTDRILTTHAGSLPRPAALTQAIVGHDRGTLGVDEAAALPTQIRDAVATIAKTQTDEGIDVINDGEASKIGYSTYVRERLSGFSGKGRGLAIWDLHEVPEFAQRSLAGLDPQNPRLHRTNRLSRTRRLGGRHRQPSNADQGIDAD